MVADVVGAVTYMILYPTEPTRLYTRLYLVARVVVAQFTVTEVHDGPTAATTGPAPGVEQPGVVDVFIFLDTHLSSGAHLYIAQIS